MSTTDRATDKVLHPATIEGIVRRHGGLANNDRASWRRSGGGFIDRGPVLLGFHPTDGRYVGSSPSGDVMAHRDQLVMVRSDVTLAVVDLAPVRITPQGNVYWQEATES